MREQCCYSAWTVIFVSCTVNSCDFTVHALKKKKTPKHWMQTRKTRNPNGYIVDLCFFFFFHLITLMSYIMLGAKKFPSRQIRFMLGWGGLNWNSTWAWCTAERLSVKIQEIHYILCLGLRLELTRWPMNNPYNEHVSIIEKHTVRN